MRASALSLALMKASILGTMYELVPGWFPWREVARSGMVLRESVTTAEDLYSPLTPKQKSALLKMRQLPQS